MSGASKPPQKPSLIGAAFVASGAFYVTHWAWPGPNGPIEMQCIAGFSLLTGALSTQKALRMLWDEVTQFNRFVSAKSRDTVRGAATFLSEAEAKSAGLTKAGPHNRFVGVIGRVSLWLKTETHHLVIGPAGSQKSTACIINQLCTLQESVLVNDVKKELYLTTGELRRQKFGHRIVLLDPNDPNSDCVNPLDFVVELLEAESPEALNLTCAMVLQLYPEPPKSDSNQFFRDGTRDAITAVLLSVVACAPPEHRTLATVLRGFTDLDFLHGLLTEAGSLEVLSGAVAQKASELHMQAFGDEAASKTFEQFRIGCAQALNIFEKGGVLERITSTTSFSFAEMKDRPVSAYLVIDFASKDSLGRWSGLMQWLAAQQLVRARNNKPVTLLLDEFCNAPLHSLPTILTLLRSYGVRVLMATQDLDDITRTYGKHALETILSEADIKQFLGGIRSQTTLEFVSKALGDYTENAASYSFSKDGIGQSVSRINKRLMSPDELRRQPTGEQIVFYGNHKPIRCRKLQVFSIAPWREEIAINTMYGSTRYLLPVEMVAKAKSGRVTWRGRRRKIADSSNPKRLTLPILSYVLKRVLSANGLIFILLLALSIWQFGLPHLRVSSSYRGSMQNPSYISCRYLGPTLNTPALRPHGGDCPLILFHKTW